MLPQLSAVSLVVSGLWSLLWYREIRGLAAAAWSVAAAVTVASVVLLGQERVA